MEGPKKRWFSGSEAGGPALVGRFFEAGTAASPPESEHPAGGPQRDESPASAPERSVLSRKELARELRRRAYQRAKQARAEDPRHLAMKEAAKLRRREQYQQVKERRKEREAEQKAKEKVSAAAAQAAAKRELAERVKSAIGRGSEPGRALARDIERALQSADVRELMDQLRSESATLAAQHRGDGSES